MIFKRIRKSLSSLSIQNKLLAINITVTTTALLLAVAMAVYSEYIENRASALESITVQAEMVGRNTTAALIFKDKEGTKDILQAFSASSDVQKAVIYDAIGIALASYTKKGLSPNKGDNDILNIIEDSTRTKTNGSDNSIFNNKITILQNIDFEDEIIGVLFIEADISHLYVYIINYLIYTAGMALLALAMATLLLLKLTKSITRPINTLTRLMETVTSDDDYSIRSDNHSPDEIGVLSQYFNRMLAHIQLNDQKLAHELSERYKAEKHLDKLAYYDVTTNLPNRHFFQEHLNSAVEQAINKQQKMALLFLDLDNFKIVNDTLGHKTGDTLLKQASSRLSNVLRQSDYICRIGGDEFAIVLENVKNINHIANIAEKCINALSNPFVFDDNKFFIGVSIGISTCPDDAVTANNLLVNADIAMYEAKMRGKNNYQYFSQEMDDIYSQKYQVENELRHAIQNNQMELYYQPQYDAKNGELTGIEALMRWHHPERGIIPPDIFIPVAEESGLILPLGDWLIDTACQHGKQFTDCGSNDITIAINISSVQIQDISFIDKLSNALKESQLTADCLEIELTESTLMDDSEMVIEKLKKIRDLGIHIAIDDFGTGFSSMNYLKRFPINKLKIDKSFVSELPESSEDTAIIRAIIAMAHGLNIKVVAEGVEREDQVEFLRTHHCDVLQGYYYDKPMPFTDFIEQHKQQQLNHLSVVKHLNEQQKN